MIMKSGRIALTLKNKEDQLAFSLGPVPWRFTDIFWISVGNTFRLRLDTYFVCLKTYWAAYLNTIFKHYKQFSVNQSFGGS